MKFSVIIPTYERLDYLQRAVSSVAGQTYRDYEIIVVNDNPQDKDKVDELVGKYTNAKVIHHPHTKGGNAARNTGIEQSTGELIAFLDDDDIWLPEKLSEHAKEHAGRPQTGLVFSDCLYVYDSSYIKNHVPPSLLPANVVEAMGRAEFCPPTSSIVSIRRECVEKCGLFDENLVSLQDWDYWFRIAHAFTFTKISLVLVHFKQHLGERTSQNENKRRKGLRQISDKWRGEINNQVFTKNLVRSMYYKNSRNALLAGNKSGAIKNSFKLLRGEVISVRSVRNFIKILLDVITKRNNVLKAKRN